MGDLARNIAEPLALVCQEVEPASARKARKKPSDVDLTPSQFDLAARSPQGFNLEPHICRVCFARVVSMSVKGEPGRFYRCTNCGVVGKGGSAKVICGCGLQIGTKGEYRDAGLRCVVNPKPSPENPSEILIREVER